MHPTQQREPARDKPAADAPQQVAHLRDFQVIELRRYRTSEGGRRNFAAYFESFFPEAFEQLGAIVFGDFFERGHADGFTWLRGFHDMFERASINGAFYYGPLWREHRAALNALLLDNDDVLLLCPLRPAHGIAVLPAVDPLTEARGAQGIALMQIFAVKPGHEGELAACAQPLFARIGDLPGVRHGVILVTLDAPNNFPQLPVRSDGPYLVWLAVVENEEVLQSQLLPELAAGADALAASGLLRGEPETVILDPGPRSRFRWSS